MSDFTEFDFWGAYEEDMQQPCGIEDQERTAASICTDDLFDDDDDDGMLDVDDEGPIVAFTEAAEKAGFVAEQCDYNTVYFNPKPDNNRPRQLAIRLRRYSEARGGEAIVKLEWLEDLYGKVTEDERDDVIFPEIGGFSIIGADDKEFTIIPFEVSCVETAPAQETVADIIAKLEKVTKQQKKLLKRLHAAVARDWNA